MAQEEAAPPSPRSMKLLIVDKEPSVRSAFTELCCRVKDLRVLGEAESGRAAIHAAESLAPDLMLIEVALPDMSGFDVLRAAGAGARPLGIMLSHQSDHAVTAFAEGAVDYLLKPVSADRFANAIDRARQRYIFEDGAQAPLTRHPPPRVARCPKFLVGERQRRLYPLAIDTIDYIEADGNYVTLRVGAMEYISRDSIKRLSSELGDFGFFRIDRSTLLNIKAVRFAEPVGHGTLAFTLSSGACFHTSKTYRDDILRVLPWRWRHAGARCGQPAPRTDADRLHL
jgi:two-component system, LytTR family, response regulator